MDEYFVQDVITAVVLSIIPAIVLFLIYRAAAGPKHTTTVAPSTEEKAKSAMKIAAIINGVFGSFCLLFWLFAFAATPFASNVSALEQGTIGTYFLLLSPLLFFIVPLIPKLFYNSRQFRVAHMLAVLIALIPVLVVGYIFFAEYWFGTLG